MYILRVISLVPFFLLSSSSDLSNISRLSSLSSPPSLYPLVLFLLPPIFPIFSALSDYFFLTIPPESLASCITLHFLPSHVPAVSLFPCTAFLSFFLILPAYHTFMVFSPPSLPNFSTSSKRESRDTIIAPFCNTSDQRKERKLITQGKKCHENL